MSTTLSTPQPYLRSRLFNTKFGVNPMVTAAQPLLALLRRIAQCHPSQINNDCLQALSHEMRVFRCQILNQNYDLHSIEMATKILGYVAQRIVLAKQLSPLPQLTGDTEALSIKPSQTLSTVDNHLSEMIQQPDIYLDAIELAYLALNLTEISAESASTPSDLPQWLTKLFETITMHRPTRPFAAIPAFDNNRQHTHLAPRSLWRKRIWTLGMGFLVIIFISEWVINSQLSQLIAQDAAIVTSE